MASGKRRGVTPRQIVFAHAFCAGETKNNATKSYHKAYPGVTHNTASTNGSALLRNDAVIKIIRQFHAEAKAATLAQMIDWQELGVEAQQRLLGIMRDDPAVVPMEDRVLDGDVVGARRDAAFVAQQLKAILEILERGWPKAHRILWEDSKQILGDMLGIDPEDVP